ncbi:glutathione-S-transferase theta, GST [Xylariomycetidae sp. FL0641]|nr:glutathione-S-transferase theta, GST [Xylariomycetidae sp. FL0641]
MPPPDADLHPGATGLAKKTVDMPEQPLKLYAGWLCPFVQQEKKIPYHAPKPARPGARPRDRRRALCESCVFVEFLKEAYADGGPPADAFARARARVWVGFVACGLGDREYGNKRLDKLRGKFRGCLLEFAGAMEADEGPWFMGEEIRGCGCGAFAVRFRVFDEFKSGLRIPAPGQGGGVDEGKWRRWRTWLDVVNICESVRKSTSER